MHDGSAADSVNAGDRRRSYVGAPAHACEPEHFFGLEAELL
jgi:hypothetical protein